MSEEYDALVRNGTWELVPPEDTTNLVGCKWIFRIKRNSMDSRTHTQIHLSFSDTLVSQFVDYLAQRFSLKDLGPLSYFLGVEVVPHCLGILLSQRRYIQDLLIRTNMADAKPVLILLPTSSTTISLTSGTPLSDPTPYRAAVGSFSIVILPSLFMASRFSSCLFGCGWAGNKDNYSSTVLILFILAGTLSLGVRRSNKLLLAHP
ncbi:hypothetical protein AAG906_039745 [Vitis piasezkii]